MSCPIFKAVLFPLCTVVLIASSRSADAEGPAGRTIRRSDVVFMYDNPEMYEPYGCTVLGWAGGRNKQRIEQAHAAGVRQFACSVGFLTEGSRVIDFSDDFLDAACRNFAGEPFNVPWLWDHEHKGQPFRWWCTNSPLYRKYLAGRLEETIAVKPDGLHIDDYRGTSGSVTWLSGGFCRHCMAGFREYLAKHVSQEKLTELGIADLSSFDYREFLLARGVKPEEYNNRRSSLPLAGEFYDFQVTANTAFVAEYRKKANALRGKPVTLSVNSGLSNPQALAIAPELSYFCCEVPHGASHLAPAAHPIYIYKLGDGLNRPITSTASGQDWAYVNEHNKPCLVRSWVALSYALGHTLMAPHRQWCYTKEKGTHWYTGPTDQYAPIYRFVRQNAHLFDGYEAVAPVAVVYDSKANRQGRGRIEPICVALAERNVPFTVVIAGDDWVDYRLDEKRLDRFKAVILAEKTDGMDDQQKDLLGKVETDGRLVHWGDDARLAQLVPSPVAIEGPQHVGSRHVMVVPRAIPADRDAPMIVHLLNRHYEGKEDRMVPQAGFSLRLRKDLFAGRKLTKATLHAPGGQPVELQVHAQDEHLRIEIPKLELWAIVVCETREAEVALTVSDPDGVAASARAPVSVRANLETLFGDDFKPGRLKLVELTSSNDRAGTAPVPVQFSPGVPHGTLWWLMPPGPKGERRFRLTSDAEPGEPEPAMRISPSGEYYDVIEGTLPVLRYNHGSVPVPEGTKKHFIEGETYERGDYIHPMHGPTGEVLTDDYPADHPHHRGVWWTWPLIRWGDRVGDIWAVVQVHARPVAMQGTAGDVLARIEAENVWKWADGMPIVREEVTIRAFRQTGPNRYVDVDLRLTGLVDDVAIGGRPGKGYGGFAVRFAPGEDQRIVVHGGPNSATPQRAWVDYSSVLPGSQERTGIALFEHPTNPDYPSEIQEYAKLNCVMAAFPGDREVLLPKDKPLELRQRMWIRSGPVDEEILRKVWAAYAQPPAVTVVKVK